MPFPTVNPSTIGGDLCPLIDPIPKQFEIISFFLFQVIPVLCVGIFVAVLLRKKNRIQTVKKLFNNFIFLAFLLIFIFLYPRTYHEIRKFDAKTIKKCECLGIKSEQFGGNTYCSGIQRCYGIPYSCAQAEEKCHYEYEAEDAKIVCDDPHLD